MTADVRFVTKIRIEYLLLIIDNICRMVLVWYPNCNSNFINTDMLKLHEMEGNNSMQNNKKMHKDTQKLTTTEVNCPWFNKPPPLPLPFPQPFSMGHSANSITALKGTIVKK